MKNIIDINGHLHKRLLNSDDESLCKKVITSDWILQPTEDDLYCSGTDCKECFEVRDEIYRNINFKEYLRYKLLQIKDFSDLYKLVGDIVETAEFTNKIIKMKIQ
jgi:hypothetical protein